MTKTAKKKPVGRVALVGAGPGDAALLTLRAVELLGRADLVLVDARVDEAVLAHARSRRSSSLV